MLYRIDRPSNNITKLESKQFKELRIRERDHLQEWIAKNPEVLGEELLIIQKEFDGFNETSEQLDLLALDKDGELVII
jgi:RecB family endonuclease NucS